MHEFAGEMPDVINYMTSPAKLDRRTLEDAVAHANVPTLLMVIVQLTGDLSWLDPPYHPTRGRGLNENDTGGFAEDLQKKIRAAAVDAIADWTNGKSVAIPQPSDALLARMLGVAMGEPVADEYGPMIAEDLQSAIDLDKPAEKLANVPSDFSVVIIGAGVSGLLAASNLTRAGIRCTILEKLDNVGGSWYVNRYPGCGVDVPSHLYSYSFRIDEWRNYYASRDEIVDYLGKTAADWDIERLIRFNCDVQEARYLPDDQKWEIHFKNADGETEVLRANVMIVAVGAFGTPKLPDIPGMNEFKGEIFHPARWPKDADPTGKRVGVVGNGASAMQLVPAIAEKVDHLSIFQRSCHWIAPFEKFKAEVPESVRLLIREVPYYRAWYRQRLGWMLNDTLYNSLQRDLNWPHPELSINATNDGHRRAFTRYIHEQLGDNEELIAKVTPHYPPFGKRILLDNGWYKTLLRKNVDLVTTGIARMDSEGAVLEDGTKLPLDMLVLATGYDVVRFLTALQIYGRSGVSLRDTWNDDDSQAYLGTVIPDFPNMFCMYGPNTQAGHGGSLIFYLECQFRYIMDILKGMLNEGTGAAEVRKDLHDDYNRRVQEAHQKMIWTHPGISTYYNNSRGRVVVSNPWRVIDFWKMTHSADLKEFVTEPAGTGEKR